MSAVLAPRTVEAAPPSWIRGTVRDVLERAPNYRALSANDRQSLARAMVKVSTLAAQLIEEEGGAQAEIARRAAPTRPLARAQDQPEFGESANRIAGTTTAVLNAVSFPRFVTDLINGVFRAMLDSSSQQMQQYVQLLNAVSASAEGFERTQFGLAQVRQWVADHFPESIEYDAPEVEPGETPDPEEVANVRLRLRSGASMPGADEIRATLGVPPEESVEASNPEQLVPFARRHLARQRQQMLATMIMLGMQRIVVDSGRINAAMRFHIDTRSAAQQDQGSQTSVQNRIRAGGGFGVGPWSASADIESNIGYVSTQRSRRTEEMNTDLELNSSVEINFRSDYLPLNQMAAQAQADRIRNTSLNPEAMPDSDAARGARLQAQLASERDRARGVDAALARAGSRAAPTTAPAAGGGSTAGAGAAAAAPRPAPAAGTGASPAAPGTSPPSRPAPASATPAPATTPAATSPAASGQPAAGTGSGLGTQNPAPGAASRPAAPASSASPRAAAAPASGQPGTTSPTGSGPAAVSGAGNSAPAGTGVAPAPPAASVTAPGAASTRASPPGH